MALNHIFCHQKKILYVVFQNTVSDTDHTRHSMSEHAGLPVEEGEKFAFNLCASLIKFSLGHIL